MSCPQAPLNQKYAVLSRPLCRAGAVLSMAIALWAGAASESWADQQPRHFLVAQQIVDGLPPPPPVTSVPVQEVPIQFSEPSSLSPIPANVPTAGSPIAPLEERYIVLVNGSSPLLLDQVRRVEPGAFLQQQTGKPRIQAGVFGDRGSAQQRVEALAAQGIEAQAIAAPAEQSLVPAASPRVAQLPPQADAPPVSVPAPPPESLPAVPVPREVVFGQQPDLEQYSAPVEQTFDSRSAQVSQFYDSPSPYYVVIPGDSEDLRSISLRVTQLSQGLNVQERSIAERERPLGPHVLVGPFIDRSTAFDWDRYFRAFGLDSRVYYDR